jgi:ubiquinone/menaquinone biosynthesis C-methylase UbiE
MGFYFDRIYNPVYDFIVAQNAPYQRLQEICIEKLELVDGDKLLCAGVGTGNEILRILKRNPNVHIVAIDSSGTALRKAQKKANTLGKSIETRLMDVQDLKFPDASFDKVLCIHVTDFVPDSSRASTEFTRVLKPGGKFAITFPSGKESLSFGKNVIGGAIRDHARRKQYHKIPLVLASVLIGAIVYFPFLFRSERRYYNKAEVEKLFTPLTKGKFRIEEYPVYSDFIVCSEK